MKDDSFDFFDIVIVGAGVSGAAIARKLSAYQLNVALVEKCADVSFGVSKSNSGIIHAGFHHGGKFLKSRLEIRGNLMYDRLHHELKFPFKRVGIVVAAFSCEEMNVVERLYAQGVENGSPAIEICSRERILALEPKLNSDVHGGLYAPTGGIVEPYCMVFSLAESAAKNGVTLITNFEVSAASFSDGLYEISSQVGRRIFARRVINAAGLYADEISRIFDAEEFRIVPRKGQEYVLARHCPGLPSHVIFPVPVKNSKGMLVIPTVEGTTMIGPTAEEIDDKEDLTTEAEYLERVFSKAIGMIPAISNRDIITSFAGLRPTLAGDDFYIDISRKAPHFVQVAGIQSPGLTAAPAIAEYVKDLLKEDGLTLTEKADYDPYLEKVQKIREHTPEAVDRLIETDPAYGNVICRCESVSEAEFVEAVRKGHTTLDGIKFYTRAGMGRCQGGFCTYKILRILERRTGMRIEEITKRGRDSRLILGRIGDD